MVRHTQTIYRLTVDELFEFVGLALKELGHTQRRIYNLVTYYGGAFVFVKISAIDV